MKMPTSRMLTELHNLLPKGDYIVVEFSRTNARLPWSWYPKGTFFRCRRPAYYFDVVSSNGEDYWSLRLYIAYRRCGCDGVGSWICYKTSGTPIRQEDYESVCAYVLDANGFVKCAGTQVNNRHPLFKTRVYADCV